MGHMGSFWRVYLRFHANETRQVLASDAMSQSTEFGAHGGAGAFRAAEFQPPFCRANWLYVGLQNTYTQTAVVPGSRRNLQIEPG